MNQFLVEFLCNFLLSDFTKNIIFGLYFPSISQNVVFTLCAMGFSIEDYLVFSVYSSLSSFIFMYLLLQWQRSNETCNTISDLAMLLCFRLPFLEEYVKEEHSSGGLPTLQNNLDLTFKHSGEIRQS